MGIKKINAQPGVDYLAAGQVLTGEALVDGWTEMTAGNFDQDHMASDTSVVTSVTEFPSAPSVPHYVELDGALYQYTSSGWVRVGWEISDTAPTTNLTAGRGWYDTTLHLKRVYDTINGITGFHPVDHGAFLATNGAGADVEAARIVTRVAPASLAATGFNTTTLAADPRALGVTLEAISDGSTGVVAGPGFHRPVDIYVDASISGNLAIGDMVRTSSAAGVAQSCGPAPAHVLASAGAFPGGMAWGSPLGAIAEALAGGSVAGVYSCRMLGSVGQGAIHYLDTVGSVSNSYNGGGIQTWQEKDVTSDLADSRHAPISGVIITQFIGGQASGGDLTMIAQASPHKDLTVAGSISHQIDIDGISTTGDCEMPTASEFLPTVDDTDTPTWKGEKFAYRLTDSTSSGTVQTITITGYVY